MLKAQVTHRILHFYRDKKNHFLQINLATATKLTEFNNPVNSKQFST